jgi:IclR family acetate operon transcriptional repressor
MHASGIGKALLAELSRGEVEAILSRKGLPSFTPKTLTSPDALFADLEATRARGWSHDDEERTSGMRCLAAAIFNEHREAVAGVSISGPVVRLPDARLAELGALVRRAAAAITEKVGGVPPGDRH